MVQPVAADERNEQPAGRDAETEPLADRRAAVLGPHGKCGAKPDRIEGGSAVREPRSTVWGRTMGQADHR